MDTIAGLIDKLAVVDLKMWNNQELLYRIRRMTFEEFSAQFSDQSKVRELWDTLKKACDLNCQRNLLIDEIDERLVKMATDGPGEGDIQRKHKTY